MSLILLKIGLWLTPFYEIVFKLFPNVLVFARDTRVAKVSIGLWLAIAIGLSAIYSGTLKKCNNIWLLLFVLFIPINIHLAPNYSLIINEIDASNFWVWKPFVLILSYFLMFLCVQSMNITKKDLSSILNIAVWCGFLMSIYVLLQYFGWDQFYSTKNAHQYLGVTNRAVTGNLGQPTVVAPFIAMIVPLSLYNNYIRLHYKDKNFISIPRWVVAPVLIGSVCLTRSDVAIGGMLICLIAYVLIRWRLRGLLGVVILSLVVSVPISVYQYSNPQKFNRFIESCKQDSGRLQVWRKTIDILKNTKLGNNEMSVYPFTGSGIGSYSVVTSKIVTPPDPNPHPSTWRITFKQAHNEYLQTLSWGGIGGLFLLLASIGAMFHGLFRAFRIGYNIRELSALTSSFICIAVIAGATFVWQLCPHNFYSVLLVGLLHNQSLIKGEVS